MSEFFCRVVKVSEEALEAGGPGSGRHKEMTRIAGDPYLKRDKGELVEAPSNSLRAFRVGDKATAEHGKLLEKPEAKRTDAEKQKVSDLHTRAMDHHLWQAERAGDKGMSDLEDQHYKAAEFHEKAIDSINNGMKFNLSKSPVFKSSK